jgi:hypothetical protein
MRQLTNMIGNICKMKRWTAIEFEIAKSGKKIAIISVMVTLMLGCAQRPTNMTPEEEAAYRDAEQARAQEMLSETSPRNMNQLPKAMPEFRANVPGIGGRGPTP